jgi:hypothetical protein
MTTRKKPGPDPLPLDEVRTVKASVFFSQAEWRAILGKIDLPAGAGPQTIRRRVARFIRGAVLNFAPPTVPQVNREAWAELARVAANLNQHQRAVNEGRVPPAPFDFESLYAALEQVRAGLVGGK